jgi:arsenate reductase
MTTPSSNDTPTSVVIYHNPQCGTSRNTLAMIRNTGDEPQVIHYLENPPSKTTLLELISAMGVTPRALLRKKGTPYEELGLDDPQWTTNWWSTCWPTRY